ncbi:MAG TPA: DUF711 family protein, partial [Spirochaetota bacterium]|nr:DUF711 family protein [Spirochaetota bacterium]
MNRYEILETISMIKEKKLDIRTITMGISLFDCADSDPLLACEKIYNKIVSKAKDLVKTGEDIENTFGIPIVNKRVSVTPISLVAASSKTDNYTIFAKTLDRAAKDTGINFIGGFTSLVQKGFQNSDRVLFNSIAEALSSTERVCSSVNVASTQTGINMNAVQELGKIILETAYLTKEHDAIGCAKFVVFANAVNDNPFMAGAFLGIGEAECVINVGVSGPGVVKAALEEIPNGDFETMTEVIKKISFKITRVGQLVAKEAAKRLNVDFGIVDLSLAPTPTLGDSVAHILEEMGLEVCGTHGTTAALMMLNDAV